MNLKSQLIQLQTEKLDCLSREDLEILIENMLDNIGSIDSELRDKLIYTTFIRLIDENLLTAKHYHHILKICLDNQHLFFKIGEANTDSVFTRSFSCLIIAAILCKDSYLEMFSETNIEKIFEKSVCYLKNEKDTRGYVEGKGWAHSIAHGADLLVALVNHPNFSKKNIHDVLNTVENCLFKEAAYIDDEDERLIFVIEGLLKQDLEEIMLEEWVSRIFNKLQLINEKEGFSDNFFRIKFNVVNFLKTLYFRLGFQDKCYKARRLIDDYLKSLFYMMYVN